MTEWTEQNTTDLKAYLASHDLPSGLGTKEGACSIAAMNLVKTGKLTDAPIDCMSLVLHKATIRLQDAMPHEMRNSQRYKDLLPHMAGTGRDKEKERSQILIDWMWDVVLQTIQPAADKNGFGVEWAMMCKERTRAAAYAAAAYADKNGFGVEWAMMCKERTRAAAYAAAAYAAAAAADAAYAAAAAADAADDDFWAKVDPIGVLERATFLGETK